MEKKKLFLVGFIVFVLAVLIVSWIGVNNKKNKEGEFKIGYITDLHCYSKFNKSENKWEVNWRCSEPLANFIEKMNLDFEPDLVVEGGDLVDGRDGQERNLYPVVFDFFKKLNVPSYHILGNHETRGFVKNDWFGFTGYEKPYYHVDKGEYRLIFLDGNHKLNVEGEVVDTDPDLHYYPGLLDLKQKEWLEKTLAEATGKKILVFVHQPPLEKTILKGSGDLFIEGRELRELFTEYGVKAVFSGHIEEMCYLEEGGVKYYALEGVHKSNRQLLRSDDYKDKGVFYEIVFDQQGNPRVEMFYKDKEASEYSSFVVNAETVICNNESVEKPEVYKSLVEVQENNSK